MPVRADPTVHFRAPRVTVTLGDYDFVVPATSAAQWLSILTEEDADGTQILPGMLSEQDQDLLTDLLLGEDVTVADLTGAIYDLITVVSGHPWWWTMGLLSSISGEHGTQVLGEMARIDADQVSLGLWCNALYALFVRHMKEQDRIQFDAQLDTPPPGMEISPEEVIDEASATRSFMAMMNQTNR